MVTHLHVRQLVAAQSAFVPSSSANPRQLLAMASGDPVAPAVAVVVAEPIRL